MEHPVWSYLASGRQCSSLWIPPSLPWIYPHYQVELFGCWSCLRAIWNISGVSEPTDLLEADEHLSCSLCKAYKQIGLSHNVWQIIDSTVWILQTIPEHGNVYMGEEEQRQRLIVPFWIYSISVELHLMELGKLRRWTLVNAGI